LSGQSCWILQAATLRRRRCCVLLLRAFAEVRPRVQVVSSEKQNWGHVLGVTQLTKATSWWPTSRSKVMLGANSDADGTFIMTNSNCATIKRLVSMMNSGDKTRFVLVTRRKKSDFSRHGSHFLSTRPHFSGGYRDSLLETAQEAVTIACTRVHR